jgi:hypothetical protein
MLLQMQTEMHIMLQVRLPLLALTIGLLSLSSVQAGWHEFWDRVHLDFHRNNCWDQPFTSIDRRAASAPFGAMVDSGWTTQNTLGQFYFHPETQVLNEAGERKLHWIVTTAPESHRTVYVAGTHQPGVLEQRVDAVQQALVKMFPEQSLPAVLPAKSEPRGWPAEYIDTIDRKVNASIPNPRLPSFRAAGGLSGG